MRESFVDRPFTARSFVVVQTAFALLMSACAAEDPYPTGDARYVLASVIIEPEGRKTYVQTLSTLDVDHVTNGNAIEIPGNGVMLAHGPHVFIGLTEEPTWVRYTVGQNGQLAESGRISLQSYGLARIDYGNTIVDARTAVSVSSDQLLAIVWSPETLRVLRTVDLAHLHADGYDLEVWTTSAHEGRVYVPGRWANWDDALIRPGVSLTILDPDKGTVIGVAEDDRCSSGGRIVFDEDGYGYVMGDGRNYSSQMFARARGLAPTPNCILRIAPGATDFEADFFVTIPSLTNGLESMTELETAAQDTGVGFTKLFYEDALPDGVEPVDFAFWSHPVFKMWRIELGDVPTAVEVTGLPFSTVGFAGSPIEGHLYTGESPSYATSTVYDLDPATNTAVARFTMDGLFNGLYAIGD